MGKCPYCGKPVYFAERQLYNGKEYHSFCAGLVFKDEQSKPGTKHFVQYSGSNMGAKETSDEKTS